jgi:hypothetical protein
MESRSISARPDVAVASTSPRVTPTPPRASRFSEVLSRTVVRSAETAVRSLPGSPLMAVAVRGATGPGTAVGVPMHTMSQNLASPVSSPTRTSAASAEGPQVGAPGVPGTPGTPGVGVAGVGGEAGSLEASLAQSQEMNLYYLQVQESVNAQNRSFTTLSNVLKAEHDTVKTAIGNIR